MAPKVLFALCAQILLVTIAWGQSCGCGCGCCGCGNVPSNGRQFSVRSQSDAPTGLQVQSQNQYQGCVKVAGKLPFLGSASVQACAPTSGCAKICYGCGDCNSIGIREASCGCGCGCGCGGGY